MATPHTRPRYWPYLIVSLTFMVIILIAANNQTPNSTPLILPPISNPLTSEQDVTATPKVITTKDVVSGRYYGRSNNSSFSGTSDLLTWISTATGDLITYNWKDPSPNTEDKKRVVIKSNQFVSRPWKVKFSGDLKYVLVGFEPRRLFRSTILARYAIHSAKSGKLLHHLQPPTPQQPTPDPEEEPEDAFDPSFQLATWSSDNTTILAVHKNDIYAFQLQGNEGEYLSTVRLTWDGSDIVFNGVADWVYEEELFTTSSTGIFTPQPPTPTRLVTYLKFNDTPITPITYSLYGDYSNPPYYDGYYQYPKFGTVRYPKSGTPNPVLSIHTVNLDSPGCWGDGTEKTSNVYSPECSWDVNLQDLMESLLSNNNQTPTHHHTKGSREQYLIGSLKYTGPSEFTTYVLNRVQNSSWIVSCNVEARNCEVIKSFTQSHGWIDNSAVFKYLDEYFTVVSSRKADGLEYGSVVGVTRSITRVVTAGAYTVDEIVGVYPWGVVFKAGLLGRVGGEMVCLDSTQAHYYVVGLKGSNDPVCISCYSDCSYSTGKFSYSGDSFVNNCEREKRVGSVEVVTVDTRGGNNASSVVSQVLDDNKALAGRLEDVELPEVEYFSIPYELRGVSYSLNCKVVGPRGWKNAGVGKYPVVVDVYGGPNSQKVSKKFSVNDWGVALASDKVRPVVYLVVDGVGSGRQSNSFAFEVYRGLGGVEIDDKVFAVGWVLDKFKSLDRANVLVWGWSYGGYVSSMVMGRDLGRVVKCGVSVAPVVNWFYYDTVYTERYMSTPSDNPVGYNTSNVLNYLDNFKGKQFLLIHGNADDNVHYQQSMVLARGLELRGILFRMQSYPDENHSLGSVRPHLFKTIEDFVFNQCFKA